ncbi:MAG: molybdopterin cofactor-binding domain-containing protein [Gammaproteobacteria bacterium]|nr:molybdopterin cofactor-binding domain-containing protein [Gammaproteobacteria bacterium]
MTRPAPENRGGLHRRAFISAAAGAGLLLGIRHDGSVVAAGAAERAAPASFSAFLQITAAGEVRITYPGVDMGQGSYNALPRILADELEADWSRVEVVSAAADPALVSAVNGRQRTANSDSVLTYYDQLRVLGAGAREMLVAAAAGRWGVSAGECVAAAGEVRHPASSRALGYGELAAAAARLSPPAEPKLKDRDAFRFIGGSVPRKDVAEKVDGTAVFGIDLQLPDMLHAALRLPDEIGAEVVSFNAESVLKRRGVVAVTRVDRGVAVIADSFWRARQAAEALQVEFGPGAVAGKSSADLRAELRAGLLAETALPFPDVDTQVKPMQFRPLSRDATLAALETAATTLDLEYEVPYLSHLTMEPPACTARVTDSACEVWAPHQQPDKARQAAADAAGLPLEQVSLQLTRAGGGFGRKWELDYVRQAVQAAAAVPGRPVKLCWTREQDVGHDYYRPGCVVRTRVALGADGITGMYSRIAAQSVWRFQDKPMMPGMGDPTMAALLIYDVYDFPAKYIDFVEMPWAIPVGLWRSVTLSQNSFFAESAIDEAAVALGRDPYEFRYALLHQHPRLQAVLQAAADRADWNAPRPPGSGLGIALSHGFESVCAIVADVTVKDARLTINKLVCAFDCGLQIDPANIRAQLEGGMTFGLSAALRGEVTFRDGGTAEKNFNTQPILRFPETPQFDIVLVQGSDHPGGAGEAGVPAVAPALTNAIYAASQQRIRRLPLERSGLKLARSGSANA